MNLHDHEARVELRELLAGKLQIESTVVDLSEVDTISFCALPGWKAAPEELILTMLRHLH